MLQESGTYAVPFGAGVWVGQVSTHDIDDAENLLENRFLGTTSRSYGAMEQGPRDVTGTVTYHPQDMRIPLWAIGSVNEASSGTNIMQWNAAQVDTDVQQSAFTSGTLNPPISFTLEDSKQAPGTGRNSIRTINGAVPNVVTITAANSEKVEVGVDYIGQTLTYSSGTTTSVTEIVKTPYMFNDVSVTVNGSVLPSVKEVALEINQNLEAPHYLNGSRDIADPFPQNRDYTFTVTLDWESNNAQALYEDLYKNNGSFNAVFDLNRDEVSIAGSQHAIITMSGCEIASIELPSENEGPSEATLELRPQNVSIIEHNDVGLINPF